MSGVTSKTLADLWAYEAIEKAMAALVHLNRPRPAPHKGYKSIHPFPN